MARRRMDARVHRARLRRTLPKPLPMGYGLPYIKAQIEMPSAVQHHADADERRAKKPASSSNKPAMDRHRGRCRLAALVAAALCLVAAHEGRCGAAARRLHAVEEAVFDVAAAEAPEAARWPGGGDALGEAKWLPMSMPVSVPVPVPAASGLRFPPVVFPLGGASMSMPWLPVPGAPHAFASTGGGLPALVPPYVGATRQEQLSLWASLFNPLQVRPRLPISLDGSGDTTAGPVVERAGIPAIASVGKAAEGETVDVPTAGAVHVAEPKWGVFLGNIDHRN